MARTGSAEVTGIPPGIGPAWLKGDARGPRRLGGDVFIGVPLAGVGGARGGAPCFAAGGLEAAGMRTDCKDQHRWRVQRGALVILGQGDSTKTRVDASLS